MRSSALPHSQAFAALPLSPTEFLLLDDHFPIARQVPVQDVLAYLRYGLGRYDAYSLLGRAPKIPTASTFGLRLCTSGLRWSSDRPLHASTSNSDVVAYPFILYIVICMIEFSDVVIYSICSPICVCSWTRYLCINVVMGLSIDLGRFATNVRSSVELGRRCCTLSYLSLFFCLSIRDVQFGGL
jgi:hypothetical protein